MDKKIIKQKIFLLLIFPFLWGMTDAAFAADMDTVMQKCLMEEMQKAGDDVTIGELKARCKDKERIVAEKAPEEEEKSIVRTRLYTDDKNVLRPWTLMAHRPNYILLAAYKNDPNNEPYREAFNDPTIELEA